MPEDSGKEPTEKEQQERFDKCVPKGEENTRNTYCKTPQDLVNFLVSFGSYNVYLTPTRIKKKFPNLKVGAKRIKEFMATREFREAVREQLPAATLEQHTGRFELVLQQYFEGQMHLKRDGVLCPDAKAIAIFGQISGKYDPVSGVKVYDGDRMDKEREKKAIEEALNAYLNKITRENKAKKEGESNNGD